MFVCVRTAPRRPDGDIDVLVVAAADLRSADNSRRRILRRMLPPAINLSDCWMSPDSRNPTTVSARVHCRVGSRAARCLISELSAPRLVRPVGRAFRATIAVSSRIGPKRPSALSPQAHVGIGR